jgi:hypothetical protein
MNDFLGLVGKKSPEGVGSRREAFGDDLLGKKVPGREWNMQGKVNMCEGKYLVKMVKI